MKKHYEIYTSDGFKQDINCTEERMYDISSFRNVVMIKEIHYTQKDNLIEKVVYLKK